MSQKPFFSIILPTKNRSHLIGDAIRSTLLQGYGDFEILVGDSDDDEQATRRVVESFDDPRIRYFRTGGISMSDNWQFLLAESRGEYITVLEDKQVFYPDALQTIYDVVQDCKPASVSWRVNSHHDDYRVKILVKYLGSGEVRRHDSRSILSMFIHQRGDYWSWLPRTINSCFSAEFVKRVYDETSLNRFFIPTAPDVCAAFIQIGLLDEVVQIDRSLSIWGASSLSSAKKLRIGKKSADILLKELNYDGGLAYVPVQSITIVKNLILNDFYRVQEAIGGNLKGYTMDASTYVDMCLKDYYMNEALGAIPTDEAKKLYDKIVEHGQGSLTPLAKLKLVMLGKIKERIRKVAFSAPGPWPTAFNMVSALLGRDTRVVTGFDSAFEAAFHGQDTHVGATPQEPVTANGQRT